MLGHELKELFDLLISGLANDGLDLLGFLRFMPALDLNEIPRCAGQYFRATGVNGDIIFNANPPMPAEYTPGSIVITFPGSRRFFCPRATLGSSCTSSPSPWPVCEQRDVQAILSQDLPGRRIDISAGRTGLCGRDRSPLSLQYSLYQIRMRFGARPRTPCA